MSTLETLLANFPSFSPVIRNGKPYKKLDFSAGNVDLLRLDLSGTSDFSRYIFEVMLSGGQFLGIGGYSEDRIIYRQRKHFALDEANPRSIHLGTDIWTAAGEKVYAPIESIVHSVAFNDHYGDYGPTIILSHEINGVSFFTLYGHLSLSSLHGIWEGKSIEAGENFASIGNYPENGDWPPHLHFQVISEIGAFSGDFPGVSSIHDQAHYLSICPDPNLILRIEENKI